MTKTFLRIERRKKWNSPQFIRPGIGVKKFTWAVFRKQTHFFFSPKIISSLSFPGTEGANYLPMERCVPPKYF